jgi:phosphatidylethanolamine/phosphatidyl-N-methylethanolamine N-methyltransferase
MEKIMPDIGDAQAHESKIYYEFSHLYDRVFTRVFYPRIDMVIRSLEIEPGAEVLEVGAGTGLAFQAYPSHCHVTGIDLAAEMLELAQDKIDWNGWRHIEVREMDALNLKFEDDTFDHATAFHVVSVVPDARRLLSEAIRVTKPGGTIVIVNHFRSDNGLLDRLDRMAEPIYRWLGWHTVDLGEILRDLPLEIVEKYKTSRHSLFTIIVAKNAKPAPALVAAQGQV